MTEKETRLDLQEDLKSERRAFLKKTLATTAYVAPAIISFSPKDSATAPSASPGGGGGAGGGSEQGGSRGSRGSGFGNKGGGSRGSRGN